MQEENLSTQRKTCGSKFGLETKWTYALGPVIEPGLSGPQRSGSTAMLPAYPYGSKEIVEMELT